MYEETIFSNIADNLSSTLEYHLLKKNPKWTLELRALPFRLLSINRVPSFYQTNISAILSDGFKPHLNLIKYLKILDSNQHRSQRAANFIDRVEILRRMWTGQRRMSKASFLKYERESDGSLLMHLTAIARTVACIRFGIIAHGTPRGSWLFIYLSPLLGACPFPIFWNSVLNR